MFGQANATQTHALPGCSTTVISTASGVVVIFCLGSTSLTHSSLPSPALPLSFPSYQPFFPISNVSLFPLPPRRGKRRVRGSSPGKFLKFSIVLVGAHSGVLKWLGYVCDTGEHRSPQKYIRGRRYPVLRHHYTPADRCRRLKTCWLYIVAELATRVYSE